MDRDKKTMTQGALMVLLSIPAYTSVLKDPTAKIQETVNRTLSIIKKHPYSRGLYLRHAKMGLHQPSTA